ncbi:hypothetical protein PoB_005203400 [Plakobranchus ocellatus]|uniref:Uncharacterized protein n=1 Tax=Plakobranchus ocellatus TaxID=259542 RepID=A0AAV4C4A9_9GAST|nr:hypothetical protein PoB_005203400 [Plakobranchus ocellatus]
MYERTLIIIGIVIAVLVFIVICIASYFLAKGRRKRFEQRRRRREAKRATQDLASAPLDSRHGNEILSIEKSLPNDVGLRDSPLRSAARTTNENKTNTDSAPNTSYPAQHEIHPLLLKKQQEEQAKQQRQQQLQPDEPDPQLEALLRSCDPNHPPKSEVQAAGERPDSRRRLVASSYNDCGDVPSMFKACVDRKETTTAAVLRTPEDIEMNNMTDNGNKQQNSKHPNANGNSGIEEDSELARQDSSTSPGTNVPVPFASSPPPIPSPSSPIYSPRPPSSASVSPPPYHKAVYIPSSSHHLAGEDESPEEDAARLPLLAPNEIEDACNNITLSNKSNDNHLNNISNSQYKRTAFQKHHAPSDRQWSSAPTPANINDSPNTKQKSQMPPHSDDIEKGYDSEEDLISERDNLLGKISELPCSSKNQNLKNKNSFLPSSFPTIPSVSHSNTFPKPSRVNGVVRGGSGSHNIYTANSDDDSSSSDENDAPREFPYQKQRDDLYISEEDLDLSKENLASTSFSSSMAGVGQLSRQLSRQESRDMEEPVVGLLPSQNLLAPRGPDQLRKYPSEEGPAYSILAGKAQGLYLQDDNRSKSMDDPLVSPTMTSSSTNATASASSLSTPPYGSTTIASSTSRNGNPHHHNYHYPGQQHQNTTRPVFEGGSRLHSTQAGSPMVETYGELDGTFGASSSQYQMPKSNQPFAYDPNEDVKPWDRETTVEHDRSKALGLDVEGVECLDEEEEKDRIRRLKDVYPDQPAIPI